MDPVVSRVVFILWEESDVHTCERGFRLVNRCECRDKPANFPPQHCSKCNLRKAVVVLKIYQTKLAGKMSKAKVLEHSGKIRKTL